MATNTSIVTQVTGQAWIRDADGSLRQLQEGMRVPADAEIVTGNSGSSVQLQVDGQAPLTISENRDVQISADMAQDDVEAATAAASAPADTDTARVMAALEAGEDPFDELDPTAAVLQAGSDGAGGSSFTRLLSIVELTTPLALEYPRPTWPVDEELRFGGAGGSNRAPELTGDFSQLMDQINDDSDVIEGLNVGQYFTDPDGHSLIFSATGLPPGLTIDPNTGIITGTLDSSASQGGPDSSGIYNVVITATDPYGGTVNLPFTWTAINPPPVAEDDVATTEENTIVTGNVLTGDPVTGEGRDTDPDGDVLTVIEVENSSGDKVPAGTPIPGVNENGEKGGGSFVINPDGSYSFDPGPDFDYLADGETTTTTVTYRISDGDGGFDDATLTITVTGSNDAPVLVPDVHDPADDADKVVESGVRDDGTGNPNAEFPGQDTAAGNVLDNDSDPDDSDVLTVVRIEQNGQAEDVPEGGSTTLIGVYGTLNIDADGNYTYMLNNDDEDTERLAPGQSAEEVFTYTVSDGHTEQSTTLTIVVHGTNDRPVIDDVAEKTGGVVEAGHDEPGQAEATGTLVARDVDDGHQDALTWHLIDDDGNVLNVPVQNIETDYGTLTLDSATGEWTYRLDDGKPATQALPQGEPHVEKFTVRVQDPEGAWDETLIEVTITGTNDAPVIVGADDEGSVRELPETHPEEENHLHSQTGEVRFSDVDADADEHQVSVAPKPGNEKDYGTLTATITEEGVVTWTFEVEDSDINELAEGETVVQDYVITITDEHGAPVEQTVRITITGTNDAPVVSSEAEQHEGQVTEHTESDDGHNTDDHQVTGTIKFTDDDLVDKHEITKADDPVGYLGELTYTFNQETKEIEWTFTVPDADLNTLNKGDKVTQVYTFIIDDGNGGSVTQDVTITITGTNDIPEITADSDLSGTVTEQGVGNENASPIVQGSLKGDDVDSDASLTWSLVDGDGTGPDSGPGDDGAERKQELEGTYGKITLSTSGEWVYELDNVKAQELAQNEQFVEEFVVRVYDEHGAYSQDVIKVTVTGTNDAPIAVADSNDVVESGVLLGGNESEDGILKVDGNVLSNDDDDDSSREAFRVTGVVLGTDLDEQKQVQEGSGTVVHGAYGTLTIQADGSYEYELDDNAPEVESLYAGQEVKDIFTYVMTDDHGASSSTTLTINVTGTNDKPVINLDKSTVAKEVTEQGADNPDATDTVEGVLVADDPDSDGDEQTWQIVDAENLVATLDGTYGKLTLNESTGQWTYELDNTRDATQALGNDDRPTETFTVRVTDKHGAYDEQELVVTVRGSNDAPTAEDHVVAFDEDPKEGENGKSKTGNVLDGAENPEGGELTVISFKIEGDDTVHSVSENGDPVSVKVGEEEIGTFTLQPNGDYVFTPKEHYSGEVPVITYTIQEPDNDNEDGLTADGTLTFEITPVADAPGFGEDADKTVKEDNTIPLGLTVPVVVDDIDHNAGGDGDGDNPELLGVITISGLPSGASLIYSDNGSDKTIQGQGDQPIKIIIVDGPHTADALADIDVIKLTEEQFQALKLLPNEHDHKNIKLDISVTSYEVDDGGNPLSGIDGATTTITRDIDVRAVTDEVKLEIDADVEGVEKRGDVFHISADEDKPFKLSDALKATFEDLDGSEERWIEIAGLEPGSTVTFGGETIRVTASNPVVKIPAFDTSGGPQGPGMDSFPEFSIKPPAHWSGRMEDVTVTLVAQDHDHDSVFTEGPAEGQSYVAPKEKDSVKFQFDVAPVADGVSLGAAVGDEDTLINVLENVRKIDTDGSEQITKFELTLSKADSDAGWSFVDENGGPLESNGTYHVIEQGDGSVKIIFQGDDIVFKGSGIPPIYLEPPLDSNTDIELGVSIETIDMADVGGTASDTRTQDGSLDVRVRPVAEIVDPDNDGGVTMTEGHEYGPGIAGAEDSWFVLNSDGFDLKEDWSNRDTGEPGADTEDGEQTFALLTPKLVNGTHEDDSATGSSFRYKLADGSYQDAEYRVDLGGYLVPMEYLDTVEFQPPADVAGEFEIKVQAYTVDADHEGRFPDSTAVSGDALLTGIVINPVADGVQSLGLDPAYGREDNEIALSIRPSSKDPSETFEVTISDLPDGSTLSYDGTVLDISDGSVTIKNFDPQKELLFTPPQDESGRFDLKVEAVAVDTRGDVTDVSDPASGTLRVNVKGVADEPELELNTITVSEGELDGHDGEGQGISLGELVETATLTDTDGSETLSFKITGLPDGFTVSGASFAGGQGEGRVWTFTEDQLNNVKINTPEHFSGKLPGTLTAISTERDGDSNSSISKDFSDHVTITPTPEAQQSLTQSATITEDQAGELNFSLDVSHGDGNEEVTAVYLNQDQLDSFKSSDNGGLQLFVGGTNIEEAGLGTQEIDGVMHYVIPQDMLDQITAQAGPNFAHNDDEGAFKLDIKFDVIDKPSEGYEEGVNPVLEQFINGQYEITVTPVTDPMAADWADGEGGVQVDDEGAAQWTISTTGEHTAAITLTKPEDDDAVGADYDGSERLTQFIIDGAPEGMLVKGIQVGDAELLGTAVLVGPNKWVISLPEDDALDFDGPLTVNVVFEATGNLATGQNNLSITAISQDRGADNTAAAQVGLTLTTGLDGGPGDGEAIKISWERKDDFAATEDTAFALSDLIDGSVTLPGGDQATAEYSIVLTLPEGSDVELPEGAAGTVTQMSVDADGDEVWVITTTGTPADLDVLLDQVMVTPPADWNDNKRTDENDFFVDASLNVVLPNGQQDSDELEMAELPVTPQTDPADISVDFYTVDEDGNKTADTPTEGNDVGITVTVTNEVDGPLTVGDQVYIRVPDELDGEFFHDGESAIPEFVSGVDGLVDGDYLVLPLTEGQQAVIGNGESLELDLVFSPSDRFIGGTAIDLDVWVPVKEQGSAGSDEEGWVMSEGAGDDTIGIINNGYNITVGVEDPDSGVYSVTGHETSSDDPSGVIVLVEHGAGTLIDESEREAVHSVRLDGLPNDFLAFYKDEEGNLVQATNAGTDADGKNVWTIPTVDGEVPQISVLPPKHWSGTLDGLGLTVLSGETSLKDTDQHESTATFNLVVDPVADGLESLSASSAFGREGDIIRLNLNAVMVDAIDAGSDAVPDKSMESITLTLTGLGEHAAFYIGDALIDGTDGLAFTYDSGSDAYTITGLSQDDISNLGVLQAVTAETGNQQKLEIWVEAWTVESDAPDAPSETVRNDTFELTLYAQQATSGDDELLFDGVNLLDGGDGDDTVWLRFGEDIDFNEMRGDEGDGILLKNIETLDLTRPGFDHALTNLSVDDVLDMTGDDNILTILADDGDSLTLTDDWVLDDERSDEELSVYKDASGGEAELHIEADSAFLLQVAESLKTDTNG